MSPNNEKVRPSRFTKRRIVGIATITEAFHVLPAGKVWLNIVASCLGDYCEEGAILPE